MYTKLLNFIIILLGAAFLFSGCQKGGGEEESESFKKYGQEFEGKIAKSYQDSEEWWPPHQNHQKEHRM
jgi:hypothetical protein